MATVESKPAGFVPVAKQIESLRDRLGDPSLVRKPYRLGINSTKERPCPAWSVTVGGHTFHRESSRMVTDEFGASRAVVSEGLVEMLTDDQVATLKSRKAEYVVRWRSRGAFVAEFLDARNCALVLNPETDEPADPYLTITPL